MAEHAAAETREAAEELLDMHEGLENFSDMVMDLTGDESTTDYQKAMLIHAELTASMLLHIGVELVKLRTAVSQPE